MRKKIIKLKLEKKNGRIRSKKIRKIAEYKARECINQKEIASLNELIKEHLEKLIRLIEINDKKESTERYTTTLQNNSGT